MRVINLSDGSIVADRCMVSDKFFSRFMGLMGVKELRDGSGLLIDPCNSIHMFFMKISLDVVFLDCDNTVVNVIEGLKPWKVSKIIKNACKVIELPVGAIKASNIKLGDKLGFKYHPAT